MPRKSSVKRNRVMRLSRKFNLINKAGGACVVCGYKKNIAGLAFHHINEKGTSLTGTNLLQMTLNGAEEELNRCVLVCHNCHSEIHNPELTLKKIARLCKMVALKQMTHEQVYFKIFE